MRKQIVYILILVILIIVLAYLFVPLISTKERPDLDILIAALAFIVLLFTFFSQLASGENTYQKLHEQTSAQQALAKIQALALRRDNIGKQIYHLKKLLHTTFRDGTRIPQEKIDEKEQELSIDGYTRETAIQEIAKLKKELSFIHVDTQKTYAVLGIEYKSI